MPRIDLRPREVSDLEMIANGAFSPLEGFMCEDDYTAVRGNKHLASGLPWTIPITLSTTDEIAGGLSEGSDIALYSDDHLLGVLHLRQKYRYDKQREAERVYLTEDLTNGPNDADNTYGWAKLMAEFTLKAYAKEHGIGAASCRYFTVYGPRGVENHAVIAMIARAFLKQDPFEIWGDGTQIRNWTYIDDIVEGTILAGEKISDGTAVNLGTMERITVLDCARMVCEFTGHQAEIKKRPEMPTGPLNRVADNALAKRLLAWEPKVPFREGLKRTIDWYFGAKNRDDVQRTFGRMLTER